MTNTGTITGKLLIQVEGAEPVEIGTVTIPLDASASTAPTDIHAHIPVQHRDAKEPWCSVCGLTADGRKPQGRFADALGPIAGRAAR